MPSTEKPDAIALLKADHRKVEELFAAFESAKGDGRKKAEAWQKLWGGYLLADPGAAQRFGELNDDQRKQVVDEFYRQADQRWKDALTVEVTPQRTEKRTRQFMIEPGVAPVSR